MDELSRRFDLTSKHCTGYCTGRERCVIARYSAGYRIQEVVGMPLCLVPCTSIHLLLLRHLILGFFFFFGGQFISVMNDSLYLVDYSLDV